MLGRRAACLGVLALLCGCAALPATPRSPQDRLDLARIQSYLNALHGLRARFVQSGAEGITGSGTAWYDPGRLRLQYDAPGRMVVVASGQHLVAHRESDGATTRMALSSNPLGLLLARPLRLDGAISVTDIRRGPSVLQVSLARSADPAQGLLTLVFADRAAGLGLIGLEAVDARRQRTRIALMGAETGLVLDPLLFEPPAG